MLRNIVVVLFLIFQVVFEEFILDSEKIPSDFVPKPLKGESTNGI